MYDEPMNKLGYVGQTADSPMPNLESCLGRLFNEHSMLEELIGVLGTRLKPILRMNPSEASKDNGTSPAGSSEVVNGLKDLQERMERTRRRVSVILEELDV